MHKMFIRIGIRKTRNTDDSLGSGTKLLLPSWLLGFQHEERERDSFYYADCSSSVSSQLIDPTNARAPRSNNWTSQGPNLNSLLFSKYPRIPAHRFRTWRHSHPQSHFLSGVFIMTYVIVTFSPHEREHLCSMCAPTRALSRKVLSLT